MKRTSAAPLKAPRPSRSPPLGVSAAQSAASYSPFRRARPRATDHRGVARAGGAHQPGAPTIAVGEWVDPEQPVVRTDGSDHQWFRARQFLIAVTPTRRERRYILPCRRQVLPHGNVLDPILARQNRFTFIGDAIFGRQLLVE